MIKPHVNNTYEKTEEMLYNLAALRQRVKNLDEQYKTKSLEAECSGIDYSKDKLSQTYKFSSTTENIAIDLGDMSKLKQIYERKIAMIEQTLEILNEIDRQIIEMRYFKQEPWWKISYEVHMCDKQCRRRRAESIKQLAIALFGE